MSYIVLFEYIAGGYTGVRFPIDYEDKAQYESKKTQLNDGYLHVVAEDVPQKYARDYASLTPEVCYLTAAIEDMCRTKDGHVNTDRIQYCLQQARYFISDDRKHRFENSIVVPVAPYPFVQIGNDDTEKNRLLRFIEGNFTYPNGVIGDLDAAMTVLELQIRGANPLQTL